MSDSRVLVFFLIGGGAITFLVALSAILLVLILSSSLLKQVKMQTEAAKDLDVARFDFEKRLALIRVKLERDAQHWKHKADFAEHSLSNFHEIEMLLASVRQKKPGAARTFSDYKVAKQSLVDNNTMIQTARMRQHSAFALFGSDGASCYARLIGVVEDVRYASGILAESEILDQKLSIEKRDQCEKRIWAAPDGTDEIALRMTQVIDEAYKVFGTALNSPFEEKTDGSIG